MQDLVGLPVVRRRGRRLADLVLSGRRSRARTREKEMINSTGALLAVLVLLASIPTTQAGCPSPFPDHPKTEVILGCLGEVATLRSQIAELRSSNAGGIPRNAVLAFDI